MKRKGGVDFSAVFGAHINLPAITLCGIKLNKIK
jgi:hypothetical protein